MYPVQGMRKFVCDRLTAAAREILGAFETRVEDYEAEIARQRRLLDQVFNPEIKLQRTEILVSDQICQNLHRNSEAGSRPVPDIAKIKDELEEVCISGEQQQETSAKLTSVCDPSVSSPQPRPLDQEQQSPSTRDLPSNTSNKDGKPGSNKETSTTSVAHSEQPGNSCETETQQHVTDDEEDATATCDDGNKKSSAVSQEVRVSVPKEPDEVNTENTASHQRREQFSDGDGSPASVKELKQWKESYLVTRTEKVSATADEQEQNTMQTRYDDTTASVNGNEKTQNERLSSSGSVPASPVQGDVGMDGRPASTEMEPTSNWENEEWICRSLEHTLNEKRSDLEVLSTLWTELTCKERSQSQDPTLTEQEEQTPHHRITSVTSEQTPSKESNEAKTELKSKKTDNYMKVSDRKSEMTKNKSEDRKTSSSRKETLKKRGHYRRPEANQPNNEGPDESSGKLEEDKDGLSLKSSQDEQKDGAAASTGDHEMTPKDFREKTAKSKETGPLGRCSGGKKASRSSKPKNELINCSSDSKKSKETTSKRKPSERNKQAASRKRLNESQSSDSAQKKHKDGNSSTRNEAKEQNHRSNAAVKEHTEPSPDRAHEESSGEEKRENPFKCDTCAKVMSNFNNYKFHMKSHTVEKTFKCGTCGKMFRESWDLNKHLVIHSVEKPYKCDICGNGFTRRYNLDLHARIHTGEKPYVCSTCGKSFSSCVNMKKHTRVHTGEKPYTCKDCGKEFADSSTFKNHLRVHTGEKPFKCTFCKRQFATRTTLKRHT